MRKTIDLGGKWRFRLDPNKLGEHYSDQLNTTHLHDARWMTEDYDDSEWSFIDVPSNWQMYGYKYSGVAWYRKEFHFSKSKIEKDLAWLKFLGVDYYCDVWLNDHYLGTHEGYFGEFGFEVSDTLSENNVLTVKVDSPRDVLGEEHEVGQLKSIIKGGIGRWDMNNPEINTGGIWNKVQLIHTGPVRLEQILVTAIPLQYPNLKKLDDYVPAFISIEMIVYVHLDIGPIESAIEFDLSLVNTREKIYKKKHKVKLLPGRQVLKFDIDLPESKLWWTWDLGYQNLYNLATSVWYGNDEVDRKSEVFGIRSLKRGEGWKTLLNGVRIFHRGASYLSDQLMASMNRERYKKDVKLLVEANLNAVQTFCNVEQSEFYNECDKQGLLVYQVFPMWMMMSNSSDLVRRAVQQNREMITQLYNHPSIGIWTFGSQPSIANFEKLGAALVKSAKDIDCTRIINHANAAIVFKDHNDGDQGYLHSQRSFFWSDSDAERFTKVYDWRPDTHHYYGWYSESINDLNAVPDDYIQLVTEFGAQSLPRIDVLRTFISKEDLFPPNWKKLSRRGLQHVRMQKKISIGESIEDFIENSQEYQANLIKYHTEYYRCHRFKPCNGAYAFCFNDCWPSISWSLVDYDRNPKKAYYALQQSMAPIQLFLDHSINHPPEIGKEVSLNFYLVNDLSQCFDNGMFHLIIAYNMDSQIPKVEKEVKISCKVSPLSSLKIGPVNWTPEQKGSYEVSIEFLYQEKPECVNKYKIMVG